MHPRMTHSLTTRHGWHVRRNVLAGGSRALLVRDRAQLGVQSGWLRGLVRNSTGRNLFRDAAAFASRERLVHHDLFSATLSPVKLYVRGRYMRVSMASWTHSALFPVSETCSISTVVNVVAAKYSGARLIRILRSQQLFSLFRLSAAATHPIGARLAN